MAICLMVLFCPDMVARSSPGCVSRDDRPPVALSPERASGAILSGIGAEEVVQVGPPFRYTDLTPRLVCLPGSPPSRRQRLSMPATSLALLVGLLGQPAPMKLNAVQPLPDKPPAWLDGYRLRWPLRVIGDPAKQTAKSVITSVPTGGWLRPDASDIAVQAASG